VQDGEGVEVERRAIQEGRQRLGVVRRVGGGEGDDVGELALLLGQQFVAVQRLCALVPSCAWRCGWRRQCSVAQA
jgi:hypothetical protein